MIGGLDNAEPRDPVDWDDRDDFLLDTAYQHDDAEPEGEPEACQHRPSLLIDDETHPDHGRRVCLDECREVFG